MAMQKHDRGVRSFPVIFWKSAAQGGGGGQDPSAHPPMHAPAWKCRSEQPIMLILIANKS